MPLRFFHKFDDANGNSIINMFEDWFAERWFSTPIRPADVLTSFLKNAERGGHALAFSAPKGRSRAASRRRCRRTVRCSTSSRSTE